ncbi:conserved Plasmodium protein, unknown function [Plasmodium ovale wallikeri]|uniref:STEEP1 domain-containing protein n=2 Tax=Plasmodium ovale TaxID=36330 RepID=A0A1A9A2J6_PLAOA|nr:conserved Plasmodium protein, unknown function [Plasmodium ovale wallikeri]SBT50821.1 conserved Plasmodium protein, unknown function [Plasmodium ovale wallikeri]
MKAFCKSHERRAGLMEESKINEKNEVSLLEIKRKVQNEQEALKDDNKQRKFRILNYTSKDSIVNKIEKDFLVYFCFVCGYNCLISEIDINHLPKRKTDGSIIFPFKKITHKKFHKTQNEKIKIKRKEGVETQYRILCKECTVPIGYVTNLQEDNAHIYYYDYSLLKDQTKCKLFSSL